MAQKSETKCFYFTAMFSYRGDMFLIQPCNLNAHITILISQKPPSCCQTVIEKYFKLGVNIILRTSLWVFPGSSPKAHVLSIYTHAFGEPALWQNIN